MEDREKGAAPKIKMDLEIFRPSPFWKLHHCYFSSDCDSEDEVMLLNGIQYKIKLPPPPHFTIFQGQPYVGNRRDKNTLTALHQKAFAFPGSSGMKNVFTFSFFPN